MRPENILRLLKHEPFIPFRICLTDGYHYDIRHREFAMVDRSIVHVGILSQRPGATLWEEPIQKLVDVALLHIVKTEALEHRNGSKRRKEQKS